VVVEAPCGWFAFAVGDELLVGGERRRIRRRAGLDARPLVAFDGTDDRDGAEALRGAVLELERAEAAEPAADTYFHFDLVGCTVDQGGRPLGHVTAVEEGVAHDVLVLDSGLRLPFVAAIVPVVDVPGRRIGIAADVVVE
jgi:16S rRNA processing protein RimM